jgi:D-sedoheptulose 7-phosphate isomerase
LEAVEILYKARREKSTIWLVGNGGSASIASHFANDLWKVLGIEAIALPAQVGIVTAYGNDDGWENMFAHALEEKFKPGDVLIAISCSGRSKNVVEAVRTVLKREGQVIALTGAGIDSNILAQFDITKVFAVNVDIKVQEDVHLMICHAIVAALADDGK